MPNEDRCRRGDHYTEQRHTVSQSSHGKHSSGVRISAEQSHLTRRAATCGSLHQVPKSAPRDRKSVVAAMADPLDDDFDQEDEELLGNIGEHSLLSRVQKRLWDQLQRKKYRIELELREVSEDADRSRKEREDLGVELYGLQQQLAKLQIQLEGAHSNAHLIADIRKKAEGDLKRFREVGVSPRLCACGGAHSSWFVRIAAIAMVMMHFVGLRCRA